jgi:hypothetical protein
MRGVPLATMVFAFALLFALSTSWAQLGKVAPDPAVASGSCDPVLANWGLDQVVWSTVPSATPFSRAASGAIGHYVYHFGSEGSNLAQAYNLDTDTWQQSTPCPAGYDNWDGTVANDELYVVSRYDGAFHQDFYKFTPTGGGPTGTWTSLAPFPFLMSYAVCIAWDGGNYIYAGGGDGSIGYAYRYDVSANTWSALPNMPGPAGYAGGAYCQGKFYVVGGVTGSGNANYEYDPVTNTWATRAAVPVVPWFEVFQTTSNNQFVILVGGGGGYSIWPAINNVQLYDPITNTWTQETPLPFAGGNSSGNYLGNTYSGQVLSAGGYSAGQVGNTYRGENMPGGAPEAAPASVEDFTVDDNGASLIASLSWTNPTTTVGGDPLADIDSVIVERNGELLTAFTNATPGQAMSYDDANIFQAGMYGYTVVCSNDSGRGIPSSSNVWIGPDVPYSVHSLVMTPAENNQLEATLTWVNPTSGAHGGFFPGITGYIIMRDSEEGFADVFDLPGVHTSFVDEDVPDPDYYWYTVIPYNASGEGLSAVSNTAWVGWPEIWMWQPITYEWNDISGVGTNAGITGDDQTVGPFQLGFNFTFFGNTTFSSIYVCSNGWQSFTSTVTTYSNVGIPNAAEPNNMIAPFWDDLYPPSGGTVYYYQDTANHRFIIQYTAVPHILGYGPFTFQTVLHQEGTIDVFYNNIGGNYNTDCTVGIENDTGTEGVQVCYNGSGTFLPTSGTAIRFSPPVPFPTGSLEGYVYENAPPNDPVEGARVVVLSDTDYTDATGFFHIDDIFIGERNARAWAFGYNTMTEAVVIGEDSLTNQDFYLPQPIINVDVTSIDVAIPASTPHEEEFNISNMGDGRLDFEITITGGGYDSAVSMLKHNGPVRRSDRASDETDNPWIAADPHEGNISPQESQLITLSFMMPDTAEVGDTYNADLLIDNNTIVQEVVIPISVTIVLEAPEAEDVIPTEYTLYQNYPNPFNPTTRIRFDLRERSHVTLEIFNILGQRVSTVLDGTMEAGQHFATFDASRLASGVYFYRITANDFKDLKKMVLVR